MKNNKSIFKKRYVLGEGYLKFDTDLFGIGDVVGVGKELGTRECKKLKQPKPLTTYYTTPKYRLVLEKI